MSYDDYEAAKGAAYQKYEAAKLAAYHDYAAIDRAELLKFRTANFQKYLEWLDADKLEDYQKIRELKSSVPELAAYEKASNAALKKFEQADEAAFNTYEAEDSAAFQSFSRYACSTAVSGRPQPEICYH